MLLKRMMGVILLVGLLLVSFYWLPAVLSAEPRADLTVTTLLDEMDGSCSDGDCSLRDAVQLVPAGGTVDFDVTGIIYLDERLTVAQDVVIVGPGIQLLQIHGHGFDVVEGVTMRMKELELWYGSVGSAVVFNEGHVIMERVRFIYNEAIGVHTVGTFEGDGVIFFRPRTGSEAVKVAEGGSFSLVNGIIDFRGVNGVVNEGSVYIADTRISNNSRGVYNVGTGMAELVRIDMDSGVYSDSEASSLQITESELNGHITNVAGHIQLERTLINGTIIISNMDRLEITNSTMSNNDNDNYWLMNQGLMTITHSTIANNDGRISNDVVEGGQLWLGHTILANNKYSYCWGDIGIISLGYNLIDEHDCGLGAAGDMVDIEPMLGELADNGGATETIALLAGSPAIGKGNCASGQVSVDQRGVVRPAGGGCDIGAYEYNGALYIDVADIAYDIEVGTELNVLRPGVGINDSYMGDGEAVISLVSGPSAGQLDLMSDGGFTYAPPANFEGVVTFRYRATAGGYEAEGVATIEVSGDRCWATIDDGATVWSSWDATALLEAVEAVPAGGVVKAAGLCRDKGEIRADGVVALVYAEKAFSLWGGYSADNWMMAYPEVQPTVIDAQDEGSVIMISNEERRVEGDVSLSGLRVINGDRGGILLDTMYDSHVTVGDSYVGNNRGDGDVGGLYIRDAYTVIIERAVIAHNAGGVVGGVDLGYGIHSARMSDSVVEGNTGRVVGGVNAQMPAFFLENSLITYNGAEGVGLFSDHIGAGGLLVGTWHGNDSVIMNSTISHNWIENGHGGGIYQNPRGDPPGGLFTITGEGYLMGLDDNELMNHSSNYLDIYNSTIVHNQAGLGGGGVYNANQSDSWRNVITFTNSIVAYNGVDQCLSPSERAVIRTGGYNMADDESCGLTGEGDMENTDPLVGPLLESGVTAAGGVAWTHYLPGSSPARNVIPVGVNGCGAEGDRDQRGMTRPLEGACDMGAHEMGRPTLGIVSGGEIELMEGGTAVIGLDLAYGIDVPVVVDYELVGGTAEGGVDSTEAAGTVTIGAGETEGEMVIEIVDDALVEGREWFYVRLSSAEVTVGGGWVRITIVDDDSLTEKMYLPVVVR
ncbi:MAG TPA: choice-of-anchor Q domain-containing protein [Anaerolineae bacterium]|nr:choice-of-anchor Q domain-containing protein [Anaerolineae bacterium]